MYKFIRSKQNINQIYAFGYLEAEKPSYDPNIFEEVELEVLPNDWTMYKEIPLAMGTDLVQFLNAYKSGIGPDKVKALLTKLAITYLLLENSDFNPFTEKTFDFVLADLDIALNGDAQLVKQICLGWAKDKRFAEKK